MGNFQIENRAVVATIVLNTADTDDGCIGTRDFDIKVPAGTTKHVAISITSPACKINGASVAVDETIMADKQYVLTIEGDDTTTPQTDTIQTIVRQVDDTGPVDAIDTYIRSHSGNLC